MSAARKPLFQKYPVESYWELTLPDKEVVKGRIYTTDEAAGIVVLQSALAHTTLATDIRMIQASSIVASKQIEATGNELLPTAPLPKIDKKTLMEREKRALKIVQESLLHINQDASPEGQACFDRLIKACGEVSWKKQSIIVLKEIQIDPPYTKDNCKIIGTQDNKNTRDSLERVKRIVAMSTNGNGESRQASS